MNWQELYLKYQRYKFFTAILEPETLIFWFEFPNAPKNWWGKRKINGKEETNKKQKKKINLKFYSFIV